MLGMLRPHQALPCACHLHPEPGTYPRRRPRRRAASNQLLQLGKSLHLELMLQTCRSVFTAYTPTEKCPVPPVANVLTNLIEQMDQRHT